MPRSRNANNKAEAKRKGINAAKDWLTSASIEQRLKLASYEFQYGEVLRDLPEKGILVPRSADPDFSWGFFKQAKGWAFNVMFKAIKERRAGQGALARTRIFVSYSHQDASWLRRLQIHMKPLIDLIDFWDDTRIKPGMEWRREIDHALTTARVAILLISADFLASDFIQTNELPPLLQKAASDGTQVLSLIVKPCLFVEHLELSKYQAVNDPSKPLSGLSEHDTETALLNLARHVVELVKTP